MCRISLFIVNVNVWACGATFIDWTSNPSISNEIQFVRYSSSGFHICIVILGNGVIMFAEKYVKYENFVRRQIKSKFSTSPPPPLPSLLILPTSNDFHLPCSAECSIVFHGFPYSWGNGTIPNDFHHRYTPPCQRLRHTSNHIVFTKERINVLHHRRHHHQMFMEFHLWQPFWLLLLHYAVEGVRGTPLHSLSTLTHHLIYNQMHFNLPSSMYMESRASDRRGSAILPRDGCNCGIFTEPWACPCAWLCIIGDISSSWICSIMSLFVQRPQNTIIYVHAPNNTEQTSIRILWGKTKTDTHYTHTHACSRTEQLVNGR